MKITLYLPYFGYEDNSFDVDNNYYTSDSYIEALNKSFASGNDIFSSIGSKPTFDIKNFYGNISNNDNIKYSKCDAVMYDTSGNEETFESFIKRFVNTNDEPFVIVFSLDENTIEEEFEGDFKSWYNTHMRMANMCKKEGMNDDKWLLENTPIKQMNFTMYGKDGKLSYGEFIGCKMVEKFEENNYAILIDKINFTKDFLKCLEKN